MTGDPAGATSYDQLPYIRAAFAQTHPDRLAAIGRLFGLDPAPPERCSVLEIGCASGDNLAPMAAAYPESHFVGVDLSARQIEAGCEMAARAGLSNLSLQHRDLMEIDAAAGHFDYILCHGVYSWVPSPVQTRILEICHDHLTPQGIAFVSYNTLPGWHLRGAVRELMRFHSRRWKEPLERVSQAKRFVAFLARSTPDPGSVWAAVLREEAQFLAEQADSYVFHDFLEDENEPLYFREFAARAAARGLQVLGDARLARGWIGNLPEPVRAFAAESSDDRIEVEQYIDLFTNRTFRQTLLCHAERELAAEPTPGRFDRLAVSAELEARNGDADPRAATPCEFGLVGSERTLTTADPISKAALLVLYDAWPQAVAFPQLFFAACERLEVALGDDEKRIVEVAEHLAGFLLRSHLADLLGLHAGPLPLTTAVSERPAACPFARLQADADSLVTNRRHIPVSLSDASRWVLRHADGSRDRAALLREMEGAVARGELPGSAEGPETVLRECLARLGRAALLVA